MKPLAAVLNLYEAAQGSDVVVLEGTAMEVLDHRDLHGPLDHEPLRDPLETWSQEPRHSTGVGVLDPTGFISVLPDQIAL